MSPLDTLPGRMTTIAGMLAEEPSFDPADAHRRSVFYAGLIAGSVARTPARSIQEDNRNGE